MPSISATWLPSANVQTLLAAVVSGEPDYLNIHIGFGTAASAPGTYGALSNAGNFQPYQNAIVAIERNAGVGSMAFSDLRGTIGAAGDLAWVCLFMVSPISGSVPLAIAGPFTVTA